MLEQPVTSKELLRYAKKLPLREQLQLAEKILASLARQLPQEPPQKQPLRSLLGLWQGFTISEEEITQARREMWGDFGECDF